MRSRFRNGFGHFLHSESLRLESIILAISDKAHAVVIKSSIGLSVTGITMSIGAAFMSMSGSELASANRSSRAADSNQSAGSRTRSRFFSLSSDALVLLGRCSRLRLSASGRTALLQTILKLNTERNSDQQTWRWFRAFVIMKYCRFLRSVMISNGS
jgi:hypothetical protein